MDTLLQPVAIAEKTVTLQPVAMVTFTEECIYSLSRLRQPKEISYREFVRKFADNAISMHVNLGPGKLQILTAYGFGLDCWYIIGGEQ